MIGLKMNDTQKGADGLLISCLPVSLRVPACALEGMPCWVSRAFPGALVLGLPLPPVGSTRTSLQTRHLTVLAGLLNMTCSFLHLHLTFVNSPGIESLHNHVSSNFFILNPFLVWDFPHSSHFSLRSTFWVGFFPTAGLEYFP